MTCEVGDWISFYNGGRLVISCVKYINFDLSGYKIAYTDQGMTRFDGILEVRSSSKQPKLCPVCGQGYMVEATEHNPVYCKCCGASGPCKKPKNNG